MTQSVTLPYVSAGKNTGGGGGGPHAHNVKPEWEAGARRTEVGDKLDFAGLVREAAHEDLELAIHHEIAGRARHRWHRQRRTGADRTGKAGAEQTLRVARHRRLRLHLLAVDEVPLRHHVVGDLLVAIGYKAEATRSARRAVLHHYTVGDVAEALKVDAQAGGRGIS